jgi:hypothetical protein
MLQFLIPLSLAMASTCVTAGATGFSDLSLEPCLNGQVSADGTLASTAGAQTMAESRRVAAEGAAEHARARAWEIELEMQLEPCINGEVSALGTYPSQDLEEVARAFAEGVVTSNDPNYVYMRAGRIIAPAHLLD